jgi:hypothetical protein
MLMGIQLDHATFEIRQGNSFGYAREIIKPFGSLDCIIAWCKAELEGEWRWQLIEVSSDQRPGRYIFYFDSDRDACAFALKWA